MTIKVASLQYLVSDLLMALLLQQRQESMEAADISVNNNASNLYLFYTDLIVVNE